MTSQIENSTKSNPILYYKHGTVTSGTGSIREDLNRLWDRIEAIDTRIAILEEMVNTKALYIEETEGIEEKFGEWSQCNEVCPIEYY